MKRISLLEGRNRFMEFLFENPLILLAIIGFISSLFTKGKKEEEKRRKPAQRPVSRPTQPQQPAQASPIERKREELETRAKRAAAQMEQQYAETRQKADEELEALKQKQRYAERRTAAIRERMPAQNTANTNTQAQAKALAPDKQKLADAIIWSEILGPPRAMNPHRSVKRK